jgi:uncharacterized protein (TIGR03435 family)
MIAWYTLFAQAVAPGPVFEVTSVKHVELDPRVTPCLCEPNRVAYRAIPLRMIIQRAYNLQPSQIVGPDWLDADRFDVDAKLPANSSMQQVPAMLRALLADRFKLSAHTALKEAPSYALVAGRNGSKLKLAKNEDVGTPIQEDRVGRHLRERMPMANLAHFLSIQLGTPVADETGLEGLFMIALDYAPEYRLRASSSNDIALAPPLQIAVQEQLGLKLESRKSSIEFLTIERIERVPMEN